MYDRVKVDPLKTRIYLLEYFKCLCLCMYISLSFFSYKTVYAESMADYTLSPPNISRQIKANVIFALDISGSMKTVAYRDVGVGDWRAGIHDDFDPDINYYGYFKGNIKYIYDKGNNFFKENTLGDWDGNFMNWLSMRRIDVARRVMIGGKVRDRSGETIGKDKWYVLQGNNEPYDYTFKKQYAGSSGYTPYPDNTIFLISEGQIIPQGLSGPKKKFRFNIMVGVKEEEPHGIIQDISSRMRIGLNVYNYDHTINPGDIYTGNTVNSGTFFPCYPDVSKPVHKRTNYDICLETHVKAPVENVIRVIETYPLIWGTTPIAESLYEIYDYCAQNDWTASRGHPHYYENGSTKNSYEVNDSWDPYYYSEEGEKLGCAKTFVLHFNGGEPDKDWDGSAQPGIGDFDNDGNSGQNKELDDIALYIREKDIRPGDLDGHQEIITYYVYAALGEKESNNIFTKKIREAAVNGGFTDKNGDNYPNPVHPPDFISYINAGNCSANEWDKDADCNPDAFYFANNGYELVDKLTAAFESILARISSGTTASVVSSTRSGEGAVYQAVFYPSLEKDDKKITWAGDVHALLIDAYGNIREDTNQNRQIDPGIDKFIMYDGDNIYKYTDLNADGQLDSNEITGSMVYASEDIKYLWKASDSLNQVNPVEEYQRTYNDTSVSRRYIFTFVDSDGDMVADNGEQIDFVWNNNVERDKISPYLHLFSPFSHMPSSPPSNVLTADWNIWISRQQKRLIEYIRGMDYPVDEPISGGSSTILPKMRSRQIDYDGDGNTETWKLGDIINSTPSVAAAPAEKYHLIYSDSSYAAFYKKYKNRRNVVYAGSNDGMFHAFNAGFYDRDNKGFKLNNNNETEFPLGAELWAYIPFNLLPHLYWLSIPDYSHIYYNDLKPKIFDAKIFTPDSIHPEGWGTLLVGGMRFGGGKIRTDKDHDGLYEPDDPMYPDQEMRSAYFIMDITDPESPPKVLAEIGFDDLGFTTAYPAVIYINPEKTTVNNWYLVLGSGPIDSTQTYTTALTDVTSNQQARLYIIDLKDLAVNGTLKDQYGNILPGADPFQVLAEKDSYISDMISVDFDLDYTNDAVYFGTVSGTTAPFGGKLLRIKIDDNSSPSTWIGDSILFDARQPITAAPTVGMDKSSNLWIYFGTGRFLNYADASDSSQQSLYGIKEPVDDIDADGIMEMTWGMVSKNNLLDVTDVNIFRGDETAAVQNVTNVSNWEELTDRIDNNWSGWYLDLDTAKERSLGQASLLGDILTFITYIPSPDTCSFEGESKLYALYYKTGTAFHEDVIYVEDAQGKNIVNKKVSLGKGLSMSPAIHTGEQKGSKAIIQGSGGDFKVIDQDNPGTIKSGVISWKEEY